MTVSASTAAPLLIADDTRDFVSNGKTYIGLSFGVKLPNDTAKEMPRAMLRMDNVGRDMTAVLEGLPPAAVLKATLKVVHRSTPDVVDYQFSAPMSGVHTDTGSVSSAMGLNDLMRKPAVALRYDPVTAPGLFPD
jgi:hypothetical protein